MTSKTSVKSKAKKVQKRPKKAAAPSSEELCKVAINALEDIKGQAIECIDVHELTAITDFMIISTGTSNTHIKALADEVVTQAKEAGGTVVGIEGKLHADWVLVDLNGCVVHIMMADVRDLYKLEDLWKFQPSLDAENNPIENDGS